MKIINHSYHSRDISSDGSIDLGSNVSGTRRNSSPAVFDRPIEVTETRVSRSQSLPENLLRKPDLQGLITRSYEPLIPKLLKEQKGKKNQKLSELKRTATGLSSFSPIKVFGNAWALVKRGGAQITSSTNAIKKGVQQGHTLALYTGFAAIGASLASLITGLVSLAKTVATEEETVDEVDEVVDPQDVELEASIKQKEAELKKFEEEHDLNLTDEQLEKNYDRLRYLAEKELHDKLMEDPANVTYGNDSNGRDDHQLRRELKEEVTKAGQNAVDEAKQELQEYREQADQYRREIDELKDQQKQTQPQQQNPQNISAEKFDPVAAPALLGASAGLGILGAGALYRPIKDKVLDPAGKAVKSRIGGAEETNKGKPASKPMGDLDIPTVE